MQYFAAIDFETATDRISMHAQLTPLYYGKEKHN